jgi:putative oxidoreductase
LQRLYSTFPNGWPGAGLAVLRVAIGAYLISIAFGSFESADFGRLAAQISAGVVGLFLIGGFWTPIAGLIACFLQMPGIIQGKGTAEKLLAAAIGVGLASLGPGAWSVDAVRYGRKRISLRDHPESPDRGSM